MAALCTFSLPGASNTLESIMVVMPLHGKCAVVYTREASRHTESTHRGALKWAIPPDVFDNNNHVCTDYRVYAYQV